jgi:GNAT superfamily N-acetyltransferase
MLTIERLERPVSEGDLGRLASLLADAVAEGSAVSFVRPFPVEEAAAWWMRTLESAHPGAVFLVARESGEIVGTAQLHPAWAPNQPHRAEVVKVLVDRGWRGRGIGDRLMAEIEAAAAAAGLGLLTLDAKKGSGADRLYRRRGWVHAGTIPGFAVDPDGVSWHDAVIFYKRVGGA